MTYDNYPNSDTQSFEDWLTAQGGTVFLDYDFSNRQGRTTTGERSLVRTPAQLAVGGLISLENRVE